MVKIGAHVAVYGTFFAVTCGLAYAFSYKFGVSEEKKQDFLVYNDSLFSSARFVLIGVALLIGTSLQRQSSQDQE